VRRAVEKAMGRCNPKRGDEDDLKESVRRMLRRRRARPRKRTVCVDMGAMQANQRPWIYYSRMLFETLGL
jgi:hypothetical protein